MSEPTFVHETEALLRLALLSARLEGDHVTFRGFCDDLREALHEAFERGRRDERGERSGRNKGLTA